MIFVGDIAVPGGIHFNIESLPEVFSDTSVVAILEGGIVSNSKRLLLDHILFNGSQVIDLVSWFPH